MKQQGAASPRRNRVERLSARTFVRRAQAAVRSENTELAEAEVLKASRALDKAAAKGVIHKNNAARRKSRLMAHFNSIKE